jgi:hypothetical protein
MVLSRSNEEQGTRAGHAPRAYRIIRNLAPDLGGKTLGSAFLVQAG